MPYVIQSTYRQDYTLPNVDRYNISKEYQNAIKEDAEAQKKCIPPENNTINAEKTCESEWTKLERMELIVHRKMFADPKADQLVKTKTAIDKPNKFTQTINKELCVSPKRYKKCPGNFITTYQNDFEDLHPDKSNPYDNLTPNYPRHLYEDFGDIIVPDDKNIADYTKRCATIRKIFNTKHRLEISNAIPSGKCLCNMTEYQDVIGGMGAILKKKKLDDSNSNKGKKGKRTCIR